MPSPTSRFDAAPWLVGLLCLCAAPASAQVIVETTTSTTTEVTITGRVTTSSTQTVLVPEAPPPVVVIAEPVEVVVVEPVVVEPAPIEPVVAEPVVVEPAPEPTPHPAPTGLTPLLVVRGELGLRATRDGLVAPGGTALFGFTTPSGWGGGAVVGHTSPLGFSDAPSELQLALEAWRDFGPDDDVALRLVGRAGTVLALEAGGPSPRMLGQLGLGARMSLDRVVALLLDARGELQMRPGDVSDEGVSRDLEVVGGFVATLGLAIHLD